MAESYSVKARLSATDSGFSSTLKNAVGAVDSLASKIKSGFSFGVLTGMGQKAFSAISSGVNGLFGEINSSNAAWKTFAGNMQIIGKNEGGITAVKKELQRFAEQTVYNSSDMAQTYAQLAAVGTKNTAKLVKGFGGLAAAAENPQQAMKTLSQQGTQMAAKPTVAWQDFKLMLEQTPAGMAAVAKQMGMTTSELVSNIQKGEVSTKKFFDAVQKVGTSSDFTKLATQPKTAGQALDGLKETVANKLTPAFEVLSQKGIRAINAIADRLSGIDAQGLAAKISSGLDKAAKYWEAFKSAFSGVGSEVWAAVKEIGSALTGMIGEFGSSESVDGFKSAMKSVAEVIKGIAGFAKENAGAIATLIKWLPAIVIGLKGFGIAKAVLPGVIGFGKGIASLAGKGIGAIAGKLFGISGAQKTVGSTSATSGAKALKAAKSYAMMGAAVLLIAAGFALLTQSAIALAAAGPMAIGVMAGLVIAVGAIMAVMALLMKMLAPMSGKLAAVGAAFLAMGAAVLLISVSFVILAQTAIALAAAGWPAIAMMVALVAVIALLAIGAAALGPALTAGAVGLLAFGAAVLMVGAGFALMGVGALLAAAALQTLIPILPTLTANALKNAAGLAVLAGGLTAFGAAALIAGGGALALGAGVLVLAAAAGVLALALGAVSSQTKTISKNAKAAEESLTGMKASVKAAESGLDALGSKVKAALKALASGYGPAYSAGAYISKGFANGMLSQLGAIQSAANKMAAAADKAVRAKAKIQSPSKVAEKLGAYWGSGYASGLDDMVRKVWASAEKLVSIPAIATPDLALAYGAEMSADYDYYRNADYTIEVPLTVDGKEFARATASYTQSELDRQEKRSSRKQGRV